MGRQPADRVIGPSHDPRSIRRRGDDAVALYGSLRGLGAWPSRILCNMISSRQFPRGVGSMACLDTTDWSVTEKPAPDSRALGR